ncbi:hypothetical protein FOQG_19129 [Fusarium oxysporum f. sp. raphani 54005]|uniref:Uncharacterized protein n=1 Tax=Fusarium oxysporum f. sp. raphani 54005 TaxID=1089458 RepID=X0B2Y1_FUSOX|nr:hypothetical protein FOQG_19129 [Fusarium oxysporum f. sp. raphani 54005]
MHHYPYSSACNPSITSLLGMNLLDMAASMDPPKAPRPPYTSLLCPISQHLSRHRPMPRPAARRLLLFQHH